MNVYLIFWEEYSPGGDLVPSLDKIFSTKEAAQKYVNDIGKEYPRLKSSMSIEEYLVED